MDRFEKELVDLFEDEVKDIKASREFKNKIIKKTKKENVIVSFVKNIWNYEVNLDLRACILGILLIVTIPTVYVFNKASEQKENEVKTYNQNYLK